MNSSDAISMYTKSYNYNQSVDVSNKTDNDSAVRAEVTAFIREVNYWIGIIEICMVVFGVIGNTLALIIINRPSLRNTSSSVFITYLAIFDSLVLIVHLTGLILLSRIKFYILHCLITFLADFVTFCSVWIMVIMTLERCIAIHSPLLAKRLCTVERTRHAMYSLIVFALIVFSATLPIVYTRNLNQTKCLIRPEYQTLLRILKPTTFYFIPDILLLVNIFIIYELFMARRYRTQKLINPENAMSQINAASFNRKQQQLTLMLVTVSLSFYIFSTPTVIDYILQGKPPDHKDPKRLKILILRSNLTVLWVQMSSAVRFFFEKPQTYDFSFVDFRLIFYFIMWPGQSFVQFAFEQLWIFTNAFEQNLMRIIKDHAVVVLKQLLISV